MRLCGDPKVSRKHARIVIFEGEICIDDLGSRTGVFVNEHRIAELTHLRPEDIIRLGDTHLSLSPSVFDLPLPALNQTSNIEPSAKAGPEEVFGVDCENVTPSGKGKLYAIIGCALAVVVIALAFAFSTGSGSSTEKAAKQASNPDNAAVKAPSSGNTAYVASRISDSLTVIDVSNPASPQILGHVTDTNKLDGANSVTVAGTTAFVASRDSSSLTVIDVSNPASPQIAGHVRDHTILNGPRSVTLVGTTAYVASRISDSLTVIDVSNPVSPQILGHVTDTNKLDGANSVTVAGTTAFVASPDSSSLTVIDVSNPANPQIRGHVAPNGTLMGANSVSVAGDTVVVPK